MNHSPIPAFSALGDETPVRASLPSGEVIVIRALRADDNRRLGAYLGGLSDTTRSIWAPHPFDQATADRLCASLGASRASRVVATVPQDGDERIIAYMLLELGARQSDRDRYVANGIHLEATDAS